ncbi:MAG: hypothetical protein B6I31_00090 [Desulfobacteraceae bacterium 4572_19]|nr:MAG: hypothetical protein B6I31_00090 [Desulfobacteraceae bacterium 4572_19]
MGNGVVYSDNIISDGTITVSTEATGFEKKFLSDNNQGNVWRSTVITETTITIDMGSITPIKGIVGLNTNMIDSDTTIKFESSTDDFSSTEESVDVNFDGVNIYCSADWNRRYYRFRLTKATGTYIQMGMIYLISSAYEFERNYNWKAKELNTQKWNTKQTDGGQIIRTLQFHKNDYSLVFEGISDDQKEIMKAISLNPYVIFFPEGIAGNLYFGSIILPEFILKHFDYNNASMIFEESPA